MSVVFKPCALFNETYIRHKSKIERAFEQFRATKSENPLAKYGGKDYPFIGEGPLGKHKPRLIHAHMTSDISIIYSLSGANPTVISLYGFFTHDESGTGNPPKINLQKQLVKRISQQTF